MGKRIYILLTDTGTLFSKTIGLYTKARLNHASIVLDDEMQEIYSFGRKNVLNPFDGGFVKEKVYGHLIREASKPTDCAIYVCTVTEDNYEKLRAHIRYMEEHAHRYKYNLLGLFGIVFRISIERQNAFFCTQFVAYMLQKHGVTLSMDKALSMITPMDLQSCESLQLVYRGDLRQRVQPSFPHALTS